MEFFESLLRFDEQLFLQINGIHSPWWDTAMLFFTRKESWLPLYLIVLWLIVRNYSRRSWLIVIFLAIGLVVSDKGTGIIKEITERLRPGYNEHISDITHIVLRKGGKYGFPSSHASNSFFLLAFTGYLFRNRITFLVLLLWALLVSYSRIYTGAHFPFDVAGGWLLGFTTGWIFYRLLLEAESKGRGKRRKPLKNPLPPGQAQALALVFFTLLFTLLTAVYILHKYDFL